MAMTLLQEAPKRERVGRYPKHPFLIQERPFTAQPFLIAPVLPGESMKNIYFECRTVTDPIKNSIIGWKKEFYFFYVRITDLLQDAIKEMFVDPANTDLAATLGVGANDQHFYTAKGGIDYTKRCYQKVIEHYFRDEGEAWNSQVSAEGLALVQIKETMFLDNLTDKDLMPEGPAIATATDAGDLDRLMDAFEQLRALGIANMTYEDWLRSQGISIPAKDEGKPELLTRFSDFQYPSNTIDPTSGAPSSAVSWVFKNGDRDPKFFKEPGFVIGISVTRPKVYFGALAGSAASFMSRAWDWMPSYLSAMPETSLKNFGADAGPLGDRTTATDSYWLDMRDLLLYGDQFQNMQAFPATPLTNGDHHLLALPLPSGDLWNTKYPSALALTSFFRNEAAAMIRSDGYTSLSVLGSQRDFTQGNFAQM